MTAQDSLALHVCCAPCFAAAIETMRRGGTTRFPPLAEIIFYNPNIHPLLEFRRRVKALQVYLERDPVSAEIDDLYGLREFLKWIGPDAVDMKNRRERCYRCYMLRLGHTAKLAAKKGYRRFSSTLLASREQDRDLVAQAGKEAARREGMEFFVADLREFLPDEKKLRGIYKQQYCGCIFSEEERFRETSKHLYLPYGERSLRKC